MRLKFDYFTLKIPYPRPVYRRVRKYTKAINSREGDVVMSDGGLDIGIVAKVNPSGKPERIYTRWDKYHGMYADSEWAAYGAVDSIQWYFTGYHMSLKEWKQLSIDKKDASGFYDYWRKKLRLYD